MKSSASNRAIRGLLVTIALSVCGVSAAHAQYTRTPFRPNLELTAFDGYYIASDLYTGSNALTQGHIGLENSNEYGGRFGINARPGFGFEFGYTRVSSNVTVKNSPAGFAPKDLGKINGDEFDFNFVFTQPIPYEQRATGFFTFGLGWTATDPQINTPAGTSFKGNSLFAWNFGLGTKIAISERLLLRLEGRWRITDTNIVTDNGTWCDYYGYCYSYASDTYSSGELTAGLTFRLPVGGR
jgi:opacity protein-like surface antigen